MITTITGKVSLIAAAVLACIAWLKLHDRKVATEAVNRVVQESQQKGAANAAKSKKVHDAARAPGAFERLRSDPKTCPDCR